MKGENLNNTNTAPGTQEKAEEADKKGVPDDEAGDLNESNGQDQEKQQEKAPA